MIMVHASSTSEAARVGAAPQRAVRVLCVDDNSLVADAVATRLYLVGGFKWLGHLPSASGVVDAVARLEPDVVLMDLDMPGPDPFHAMRELAEQHPESRVLVLSGHVRRDLLDRAIEAGAWGYISKSDDAGTLVSAVRRVARGEFVLGPGLGGEINRG